MEHQDQSSEPIATEQQDAKIQSKRKSPLELRRYTKQIWLAGLGAFSRAEEEGNKLFDSLVKVGEELEAKTVDIADNTAEKVGEVTGKAIERVTDTVDKVEKLIDQRTHHTLNRIGLVTPKDILLIEQLLLNLSDKVDQLANTNQKLIEEIEYLKKNKK
ncbi:MAG: phasin family protein [Acinetobacter populi]|nr:phasin family protein [Acinetobacter populi]MCH4247439.1 phasin family protein [Acinetobacter populi]